MTTKDDEEEDDDDTWSDDEDDISSNAETSHTLENMKFSDAKRISGWTCLCKNSRKGGNLTKAFWIKRERLKVLIYL